MIFDVLRKSAYHHEVGGRLCGGVGEESLTSAIKATSALRSGTTDASFLHNPFDVITKEEKLGGSISVAIVVCFINVKNGIRKISEVKF